MYLTFPWGHSSDCPIFTSSNEEVCPLTLIGGIGMSYQCPKGHTSTDPDYCSECGAKIGKSAIPTSTGSSPAPSSAKEEICPDCGTPRTLNARFCEVCRHDFIDGKVSTAEKVVAAQKPEEVKAEVKPLVESAVQAPDKTNANAAQASAGSNTVAKDDIIIAEKLNVIIAVDKNRLAQNQVESNIKPDNMDRAFPLDLDENLVGRRSTSKGIYPEIEINDPGVSHRHMKFIKQADGSFAVLELGSSNGTVLNGAELLAGVSTPVKVGDELEIGLWTTLKVVAR